MYDLKLENVKLSERRELLRKYYFYNITKSNKNILYNNTRFKYNFKYYLTLILKKKNLINLSYRSFITSSLSKFNKSERYNTQANFLLALTSLVFVVFENLNIFFLYKNLSFIHFEYFKDFFKNMNNYIFRNFEIFINFKLSFSLNRYFKKVKTIKKFKKKIFFKSFNFKYKKIILNH